MCTGGEYSRLADRHFKTVTIYHCYTGGHAVAYLYRSNNCVLIFTPEHSNRPHNPMGTVFWSTSNISILPQLCTTLTIGKMKKKKSIKSLSWFSVTLTKVKPHNHSVPSLGLPQCWIQVKTNLTIRGVFAYQGKKQIEQEGFQSCPTACKFSSSYSFGSSCTK